MPTRIGRRVGLGGFEGPVERSPLIGVGRLRSQVRPCPPQGLIERDVGGHFDVGFDAGSVPVIPRDWVLRRARRDKNRKAVVESKDITRIACAGGSRADHRGPLERLQVVTERLGRGARGSAGQDE